MQDIFVSTVAKSIDSWEQAFPDCVLVSDVSEISPKLATVGSDGHDLVFWLHMNEQLKLSLTQVILTIMKQFQAAKVVVIDNAPNHEASVTALSAGAMGYAHAYSAPEVLKEVRAVISHGGIWLGQQLLQRLIETTVRLTGNSAEYVDSLLGQLTKREQQVALEAAKGLSNKEIARNLNITDRTVKAHLASSFERLKVKDRLQLALMLNKQQSSAHEVMAVSDAVQPAILKVG